MRSTQPFPETFRKLRELQGLSEREVSKRAHEHGAPRNATLHGIYTGERQPLPHHLVAIAAALGVAPETFAEYRLFETVRLFDVMGDERRLIKPTPFDQAMHNLERFEELSRIGRESRRPLGEEAHDPAGVAAELEAAPDDAAADGRP